MRGKWFELAQEVMVPGMDFFDGEKTEVEPNSRVWDSWPKHDGLDGEVQHEKLLLF